jgi:hypothetical protein
VKIPSWVIRLKPDYAHYDADTPPEKEDWRHGLEHSDETEKYPAKNGSVPDSGSVVVHDDPQGVSSPTVNISGMYTKVESSGSSTSSALARARSTAWVARTPPTLGRDRQGCFSA